MAVAYLLVYSGCLAPIPHMSVYLYHFSHFSYGKYAFDGLILSQYGDKRPNLECPVEVEICVLRSPARILLETGVQDGYFWYDFGILMAMFIFLRVLSFVFLHRKVACK